MSVMADTLDPRINDQYTGVQLRLIQQKLDEKRERPVSSSTVTDDDQDEQAHTDRLQQSMVRRQELLERIKQEGQLAEQLKRPSSSRMYRSHDYKRPSSRHSLPEYRERKQERLPSTNRSKEHHYYIYQNASPREPVSKHILEHQVHPMPTRLEPLPYSPRPPPQVTPQVLSIPQPYIINAGGGAPAAAPVVAAPPPPPMQPYAPVQNSHTSTKQDMIEMMMLQNAQTHQMIMNQLMMSTLPKPNNNNNNMDISLKDIMSLKESKKEPDVHHHHYDIGAAGQQRLQPIQHPPPPPPPQYLQQPQFPAINVYSRSPRQYPTEVPPLRQPVSKPKKKKPKKPRPQPAVKWEPFQPKAPTPVKKFEYPDLPFPGPRPLRRFRHAAYAAYFSKLLQKAISSPNFKKPAPFSDDFLFGIRLKEAVAALHYQYLNPLGKIKRIFDQVIAFNSKDLTLAVQPGTYNKEKTEITQDVAFILENIAFEITEIMPMPGVLGTHRKAVVYDMIKPGKLYPDTYFWDVEKTLLTFDGNGRTIHVDNVKAFILLAGCFVGRALVTTLLLKPVEFGLLTERPSIIVEGNLRLLASLFVYLLRILYSNTSEPVDPPHEIGRYLYSDAEIDDLVKRLKKSFDYCVKLFDNWGREYLKRLRKVQEVELGRLYSP